MGKNPSGFCGMAGRQRLPGRIVPAAYVYEAAAGGARHKYTGPMYPFVVLP